MKSLLIAVGAAGLLLGLISVSEAQRAERVFPIFELTDEDVALMDVTDGSIEDWLEVVGEPSLTALNFEAESRLDPYDPLDLDFRIWLAWHGATHHLYVAMERADDLYVNEYLQEDLNMPGETMLRHDSSMALVVDGDHSGGKYFYFSGQADSEEERRLLHNQQAQLYPRQQPAAN